jgi:hypothetical protein
MIPSKMAIGRGTPKHYLFGRSMSRSVGSPTLPSPVQSRFFLDH